MDTHYDPDQEPRYLFHYTSEHGMNGVADDKCLQPNPHPWLGTPLVWLTDLDTPDSAALGMTSFPQDRTRHRVRVYNDPGLVTPWSWWARGVRVPWLVRDMIEGGGATPDRWWVSLVKLPVVDYQSCRPAEVVEAGR